MHSAHRARDASISIPIDRTPARAALIRVLPSPQPMSYTTSPGWTPVISSMASSTGSGVLHSSCRGASIAHCCEATANLLPSSTPPVSPSYYGNLSLNFPFLLCDPCYGSSSFISSGAHTFHEVEHFTAMAFGPHSLSMLCQVPSVVCFLKPDS